MSSKLVKLRNAGKLGDLIAVSGNPLQDISILKQVDFLMNNGKVKKPLH